MGIAGLLGRLRSGQVWGSLVSVYVLHNSRHARGGHGVGSPMGGPRRSGEKKRRRRWRELGPLDSRISLHFLRHSGHHHRDHRVHLRAVRVLQDVLAAEARVQGPGRDAANGAERGRADRAPRASLQGIDRRERGRLVVPAGIRPPVSFLHFITTHSSRTRTLRVVRASALQQLAAAVRVLRLPLLLG